MFKPVIKILKTQPAFLVGNHYCLDWLSHVGVHWVQDQTNVPPVAYDLASNFKYKSIPVALNTNRDPIAVSTTLGAGHFYRVQRLYQVCEHLGAIDGTPTVSLQPITCRETESMDKINLKISDILHCRRSWNLVMNRIRRHHGVYAKMHERHYVGYHPNGKTWQFTLRVDPDQALSTGTIVEEFLVPVEGNMSSVRQYVKMYRSFSGHCTPAVACELILEE